MGRQFSFFLGPDDITPFEETLRSSGDLTFVSDRPYEPRAVEIPGLAANIFRT
jgi:hypothetical protein